MTETTKERIYREKLELISDKSMWHMNFKSSTIKMMMKNAKQALELAENLPDSTDKLSVEKLQEQLNTAKKALTEIAEFEPKKSAHKCWPDWHRLMMDTASEALAEIGGDND